MNEDFEQVMGDTMFVASLVADLIKVRSAAGLSFYFDSRICHFVFVLIAASI